LGFTDADFDAGGHLPFLVELIAEGHGGDGELADKRGRERYDS